MLRMLLSMKLNGVMWMLLSMNLHGADVVSMDLHGAADVVLNEFFMHAVDVDPNEAACCGCCSQ